MVEVASAEALSDTTLAAAFPLLTAAPSIRSNALDEIEEGAEEPISPSRTVDSVPTRPLPSRKASSERWPSRRLQSVAPQVNIDVAKSPVLSQKSSVSRFLIREESGHQSVTQLDHSTLSDLSPSEHLLKDNESIRSNTSGRESYREKPPIPGLSDRGELDFDRYYAEMYKPKVRLGPRPVALPDKGRRPSNASDSSKTRPVSTMPIGLHLKTNQGAAPHMKLPDLPSTSSPAPSLRSLAMPPQTPQGSLHPPRPGSRGSSRSVPTSTLSVKTNKSAMTPEKMRLMKAMELRKKQMRNSTPAESIGITTVPEHAPMPSLNEQSGAMVEHTASGIDKADSGIQLDYVQEPSAQAKSSETPPGTFNDPAARNKISYSAKPLTSSLDQARTESEVAQGSDPFIVDSPTLGRIPDPQGTLPRSPALSSLLGTPSLHFNVDSSIDRIVETKDSQFRPISKAATGAASPDSEAVSTPWQNKRRGWVEPLFINSDPSHNHEHEHNYLSDEDFLEELHGATFQEAKPISLQRSPASPFFPRRRPSARSARSNGSFTSAVSVSGASLVSVVHSNEQPKNVPSNDVDRSLSEMPAEPLAPSAQPEPENRPLSTSSTRTPDLERSDLVAAPRGRNVSSGISKRIQALAEKTVREGGPTTGTTSSWPAPEKSSFVSMRKSSLRDSADLPMPTKKAIAQPPAWPSLAKSNVIVSHSANRDSVSVTARIVRQPTGQAGDVASPPELHHSPLLINHTRPSQAHEFPPMAPLLTGGAPTETDIAASPERRERSLSPTFSYSSADSGTISNRKSVDRKSFSGRYRSGFESPKKSLSKHTSSTSLASEGVEVEKNSKTSRFFKRISTLGGNKRKSVSQTPTVPQVEAAYQVPGIPQDRRTAAAARKDSAPDIPPPIVVGDLNVQFPDTGLWKRRWVEIDISGNLIFTASRPVSTTTNGKSLKGFVTKFHFNDLKTPYVPDLDTQEMPHSVLFDLHDGATLSCASEDGMAQRQLLSRRLSVFPVMSLETANENDSA